VALLSDYLPPYGADVLNLPNEELSIQFLRFLRAHEADGPLRMRNIIRPDHLRDYVPDEAGEGGKIEMARHLAEAWAWLEVGGYLAPDPARDEGWFYVTDRGREMLHRAPDLRTFEAERHLPPGTLSTRLEQEARPAFLRGAYDSAIFAAMRVVEIHVREACGYGPEDIGVTLMRRAFHEENGPLSDEASPLSERQRIRDLFVGAIGAFKNPPSHREVNLADPIEVANIIRFADVLLRIVDRAPPLPTLPQLPPTARRRR
jgi:uncharacterized protein (TIGR02391 family)